MRLVCWPFKGEPRVSWSVTFNENERPRLAELASHRNDRNSFHGICQFLWNQMENHHSVGMEENLQHIEHAIMTFDSGAENRARAPLRIYVTLTIARPPPPNHAEPRRAAPFCFQQVATHFNLCAPAVISCGDLL